ncbi:MAG: hypothetical protein AMJ73_05615 [candidate division Zixibacteria bacterium SM1_73]|nr:MAG: hypothetical protein AMJ73_05615 [candidate division Zixibacteria bacterium SM1_73]
MKPYGSYQRRKSLGKLLPPQASIKVLLSTNKTDSDLSIVFLKNFEKKLKAPKWPGLSGNSFPIFF